MVNYSSFGARVSARPVQAWPLREGEIEADESRTESRSQPALTLRDALLQMSCRRRDPNGHHYTDGNKGCERDLLYPAGRAGHGDHEGDRDGSQDNQQHNTCHSNQDDHFLTVLLRQTRPYGSDGAEPSTSAGSASSGGVSSRLQERSMLPRTWRDHALRNQLADEALDPTPNLISDRPHRVDSLAGWVVECPWSRSQPGRSLEASHCSGSVPTRPLRSSARLACCGGYAGLDRTLRLVKRAQPRSARSTSSLSRSSFWPPTSRGKQSAGWRSVRSR